MRQLFTFLILFILVIEAFAANTPITFKGKTSGSVKNSTTVVVPHSQVTDLGNGQVGLENGNKNRLQNPGFEHSIFTTGWSTSVTGTATISSTVNIASPIEGKKTASYTCAGGASGGTCTIYQDVATSHAVQGLAGIFVKSYSSSGVKVYSRKNGANFQSKTIDITEAKFWDIPITLGTTSTGVSVEITVAASQSIIVDLDEGFVGAADLKQDMSPVGPWIDYGPMTITATTTAPTKPTTREKDNVQCRINSQDYECEYRYAAASSSGSAAGSGGYIFNLPSGIEMDSSVPTSAATASFSNYSGPRATASIGWGDLEITSNTGDTGGKCDIHAASSTTFQVICFIGAAGIKMLSSSQLDLSNAGTGFAFHLKFKGKGLSSNYSAYSTNDLPFSTDRNTLAFASSSAYTLSTLSTAPVGTMITWPYGSGWALGTQCTTAPTQTTSDMNTNGIILYTKTYSGSSTCGAPARIAINVGLGYSGVSAIIYKSSGKTTIGDFDFDTLDGNVVLGAYREFDAKKGILILDAGFNWFSTTSLHTFNFSDKTQQANGYVVLNAVRDSTTTIGQFNGLESCKDSYECTENLNASIAATTGAVGTSENLDFINGDCTRSGTNLMVVTCPVKPGVFTVLPNCEATGHVSSATATFIKSSSTITSFVFNTTDSAGAGTNSGLDIVCHKASADYIAKTAKAVASDQNIATPGLTKVKECFASYGGASATVTSPTVCSTGTCVEVEDTCGVFTPPSFTATGNYSGLTIANGTFANSSLVTCTCKAYSTVSGTVTECEPAFKTGGQTWATNSSGGGVWDIWTYGATGTPANTNFRVTCEGQAP